MLLPLERKDGSREAAGVTDNAGFVEFTGLKAGKYVAMVNAPGVITPLAYLDVRTPREEFLNDEILALPAIVVDGISNVEVQIAARRGAAINGRVSYPDGTRPDTNCWGLLLRLGIRSRFGCPILLKNTVPPPGVLRPEKATSP